VIFTPLLLVADAEGLSKDSKRLAALAVVVKHTKTISENPVTRVRLIEVNIMLPLVLNTGAKVSINRYNSPA